MKYLVLYTDGTIKTLQRETRLTLAEMQDLVGGFMELVRVTPKSFITYIVNEEGLLLNLPLNPHVPGLVGNIIVAKSENMELNGLSDAEVSALKFS